MSLLSPSTLGLVALGLFGVYKYRRYIDDCRVKIVTSECKTSAIVRQTDTEGTITLHDILYTECPTLTDPRETMVPTPYLATGLLQTIYATMMIRKRDNSSDIVYRRQLITMEDGATISLDWCTSSSDLSEAPVVMIMSGVGGSSQEHHIRALAKSLALSSLLTPRVVVVNHRGTAHTPITSSRPYDVGFTDDLRTVVNHISSEYPGSKIVGVGFSMGANILTKYMGEEGPLCPLACAVAVCCPFDIEVSGAAMNESNVLNNHVFQPAVMSTLMRALKRAEHLELNPEWNLDITRIRNAKRLSELEDELLVKINGYSDRTEYYRKSSSARFVDHITVPLLAINSLDDRITPPQGIPVHKFTENPNIALALVPHGGHLGFLTGVPPRIWFIKPIEEFITAILR
ncbi:hypothetical protein IW140_002477 [Coemansia sp. RSA 1813]|nr:hypothetical protein EV178_001950 [Coemansia sp. RSA 1646]KAJ1768903.1 hypothetical protein LPJ74_004503 [Coemansia sp. RSA 1843]KAJ2091045.1 hypothetical protein IW138_002239 [Coemansia sp. RSA 986]KAJ2215954.1 hypothetical protein EV179_001782 [Coemansia sp. RSA 487]KAJ2570201.1 hypothetical protein IW140_002477 [Coemansia sp. RSA 1813]